MHKIQSLKQNNSHMMSDNLSRMPSDTFAGWFSNKHINTPTRCHKFIQVKNKPTITAICSKKSNQKDPEEKNLPYPFAKRLFHN